MSAPRSGITKPLCTLAKRVPKNTKTGDADEDAQKEEQRNALVGLINGLHEKPILCVPTFLASAKEKSRRRLTRHLGERE